MKANHRDNRLPVSVIIHTLNEEINLPFALRSVVGKFNQVFVVDAGSIDRTKDIALEHAVEFVQIRGDRTSLVKQRNWALDNLPFKNEWVYVLDADEQVPDDLYDEMRDVILNSRRDVDGYWVRYKDIILRRWLKYSSIYPNWNMRLFKHKNLRYEDRSVNAHVKIDNARSGWLSAHFIHDDKNGFKAHIKRLSNITVIEANTIDEIYINDTKYLRGSLFSPSPVERRRALKRIYYNLPFRPLVIFLYLYVFRLGFLEGKAGLYNVLYRSMQELFVNILRYEKRITSK